MDQLSDYQLLKKDSAPWSQFVFISVVRFEDLMATKFDAL
jgi:hypothetical protein